MFIRYSFLVFVALAALINNPRDIMAQPSPKHYLSIIFSSGFDNKRISLYLNNRLVLLDKLIKVSPSYGISPVSLQIKSSGGMLIVHLPDSVLSIAGKKLGIELLITANGLRSKNIIRPGSGEYLYLTSDDKGVHIKQLHKPILLD